jgi:proliferating cell nuclear antigen
MSKLVDIETDLIKPIKTLVELLKDILTDVNLEMIRGEKSSKKEITDKTEEEDAEEEEDEDEEEDEEDEKPEKKQVITKEEPSKKETIENTPVLDTTGGCIRFTATDNTKTSIINMTLFGSQFNTFDIGKSVVDVGINLAQFHKIIKSIENDDMMRLYIDRDDRQNLVIETRKVKGESDSSSKLKLMDINKKKLNIPPTPFDAVITIDTNEFHKKCKDMSNLADYIDIQCTRKKLTFTCRGDAVEHINNFYPENSSVRIKFAKNAPDIVQGIFELKYIVMFTKCSGLCDEIQIFMKNNYPLSINYTVATLGRILFCLAPVPEDVVSKNFEDDDDLYEHDKVKYKE